MVTLFNLYRNGWLDGKIIMYKFVPRFPNYVDLELDKTPYQFTTVEELEQHPHVKSWMRLKNFKELQKSDDCLMCITTDGRFYVIGYITTDNELNLPVWVHSPVDLL